MKLSTLRDRYRSGTRPGARRMLRLQAWVVVMYAAFYALFAWASSGSGMFMTSSASLRDLAVLGLGLVVLPLRLWMFWGFPVVVAYCVVTARCPTPPAPTT